MRSYTHNTHGCKNTPGCNSICSTWKVGENLHQSVVLQGVVFMAYHTPGLQIYIQCAKIHPSSNVAHEHGFRIRLHVTQDKRQSQARPSGRPTNSKSRGPVFDPHLGCRVVSLSKTHWPITVLYPWNIAALPT